MTRRALPSRLAAAQDGAAVVEFAIVAPVFLLLLLGIFDIGQMAYARGVLNGAVERAARDGSLETVDPVVVDNRVRAAIQPVLPNATLTFMRKSYFDFADVNRPEKFDDKNGDGICNAGETFVDENRSGSWDADVGRAGNGGAGDVVLYTVTVSYKPIFTAAFMYNNSGTRTITAVGVRKNQPYAAQMGYGSSAGTCK